MARAIDADALQELCNRRIQGTWNNGTAPVSWAHAYADFKDDIDSMPTLIPPNKPLTLEQLQESAGGPVAIDGTWGYLEKIVDEVAYFWRWYMDFADEWPLNQYGKTWLAYRRPPEGEEDT